MSRINRFRFLLAVAFVVLPGVPLVSAQTTITMGSSPSGVQGPVLGSIYTSPYYAVVGSTNPNQVPIICDDFTDNTFFSESWSAYVTSLASVPTGTTAPVPDPTAGGPDYNAASGWSAPTPAQAAAGYTSVPGGPLEWGGGYNVGATAGLNQAQAYTAAAYLSVEILEQNQTSSNPNQAAAITTAQDLSYALWALFDPAVFLDQPAVQGGPCALEGGYGCLYATSPDIVNAENDLTAAIGLVTGLNPTLTTSNFDQVEGVQSVNILTYDKNLPCQGCSTISPQEFIQITMPEPSTPSLLGLDLLGAVGLILFARRRWTASKSS